MEKSLYQITADQLELFNQIDELEWELTPELQEALKLNAENFEEKALEFFNVTIPLPNEQLEAF